MQNNTLQPKRALRTALLVLLLGTLELTIANPIDVKTAQSVGTKFLSSNTKMHLKDANDIKLTTTYNLEDNRAAFYVFNAPTGFVIVAADDCAYPILGYSDEGRQFDPNDVPIQLQDILQGYVEQIQYAVENCFQADQKTIEQWQLVKTTGKLSNNRVKTQVGPLLTTTWDQGQYYNAMCPEDENGPDGHTVTGCAATAMAQIINYHGYPRHGKGTHSYQSVYGDISVNFENSVYDFDNMPDVLTSESSSEEINAVARLLYDCGVAVNMDYSASASSAHQEDARGALISYFGFAPTLGYAQRMMYTDDEWSDSLRANIDRGEPVYYCGNNWMTGHAFCLDGYSLENYFHFNFGWSGSSDGWYLTKVINTGGGNFDYWQCAIMGIKPDTDENAVITQKMFVSNFDSFVVTAPIDLYHLRGGSEYMAANQLSGTRVELRLIPEYPSGQLVLDVLEFCNNQSVAIYDGINRDSLVRVIETRGEGGILYDGQPSDTVFYNMATTDLSPIVSARHGFTIVTYSYGAMREGFHLRVSDASDCRMVSNLSAVNNQDGILVSWTENGDATQWQVLVGGVSYNCDDTHILLTDLSPNDTYKVKVRAICDNQHSSSWNTIVVNKKVYWKDIVKSEPNGYLLAGDTIRITTPEGLAWVTHCVDSLSAYGTDVELYQYDHHCLSIEKDIDLSGYLWNPIRLWMGNVNGHEHIISNMKVDVWSDNNYDRGYGGLFQYLGDVEVRDLGIRNCFINALGNAGSISGWISNGSVINCFSDGFVIWAANNGEGGGLFGTASYSRIINCYAYGDLNSMSGYGGIAGCVYNSEITNCVSRLGESFNCSAFYIDLSPWRGLITEEVHGGSFSNCFADISFAKRSWTSSGPEYDSLAMRAYFLGNVFEVDEINNLATFNVAMDTTCLIIADTVFNYTLGDNMDVITALNNWVAGNGLVSYRTWIKDLNTHLPVFYNNNTNVIENETIVATIYPNPTNNDVTIEAEGLKHITISNMLGQIVYDGNASGNAFEYDFSKHKTGIYLIRIETVNGVAVKKVSVTR